MADVYEVSTNEYPLVPLRGLWAYPNTIINFDCARPISKNAIDDANIKNKEVFLVNQKNVFDENPSSDALYDYGMVVSIKESFSLTNGDIRVYVQAKSIAKIKEIKLGEGFYKAVVEEYEYIQENEDETNRKESLRKMILDDFKAYIDIDGSNFDESIS